MNDATAPTTVPASSTLSKPVAQASVLDFAAVSPQVLTAELERQVTQWGGRGPDFAPKASNLWSTRPERIQDGSTVLINGPQFGWYNPAYTYGIGLHGAGFDVVGNTPFAYPIVLFGTNSEIAWYPMEQRKDRIQIRSQAEREMTIWRTVHGPVMPFDYEQGVAYRSG